MDVPKHNLGVRKVVVAQELHLLAAYRIRGSEKRTNDHAGLSANFRAILGSFERTHPRRRAPCCAGSSIGGYGVPG
jgi:hypothetical protein